MRKLYVGCALTDSPQDFKDLVNMLKNDLKKEYEVFEFVGLENGTPTDVYKTDVQKNVARCDMLVALCDFPSLGLGYEMATGLEKYSKPTLALAKESAKISRLIEGIDHPMYTFKRYKTQEDIISFIKEKELQHFKQSVPVEVCGTDVCAV